MGNTMTERWLWLEKQLERDTEYLHLMEQLRENMPALETALNTLSTEDRGAVVEHLGICAEVAGRIAELCCYMP